MDNGMFTRGLLHAVPTHNAEAGVSIGRFQRINQIGAVQVARCLSGYDVIFHLLYTQLNLEGPTPMVAVVDGSVNPVFDLVIRVDLHFQPVGARSEEHTSELQSL